MIATGRGLPGLRRAIPALHGVNASGRAEFTRISPDQPGDAADSPVAGRFYSFGVAKAGRALGDFDEHAERGQRALVCPPKIWRRRYRARYPRHGYPKRARLTRRRPDLSERSKMTCLPAPRHQVSRASRRPNKKGAGSLPPGGSFGPRKPRSSRSSPWPRCSRINGSFPRTGATRRDTSTIEVGSSVQPAARTRLPPTHQGSRKRRPLLP